MFGLDEMKYNFEYIHIAILICFEISNLYVHFSVSILISAQANGDPYSEGCRDSEPT